ncbi:MAG: hypothetical protein ACK2TV_11745 [Anaerolineales bacterium]
MKIDRFINENRWFDSVILIVFILAFTGATYNHVMDLVSGGLFPYTKKWGTPESLNFYWTCLTILDPLAIAALIINVRVGYVVALCIMLTDVPINLYANANYWSLAFHKNYALLMQVVFLIFLLLTFCRVWKLTVTVMEGPSDNAAAPDAKSRSV